MGRIKKKKKVYSLLNHVIDSEMNNEIAHIEFNTKKSNPTSTRSFDLNFSETMKSLILNAPREQEESKNRNKDPQIKPEDLKFTSVEPYYNEDTKDYAIDFSHHDVFISSSKNFQVKWKNSDQLLIEQVKVDKNEFEIKLRYPMSILVAFATAVTLFDPKFKI